MSIAGLSDHGAKQLVESSGQVTEALDNHGAKQLVESSGQVTEALDNLDWQVGNLGERVRALVAQLTPVMRPEATKNTAEGDKARTFDVQIAASIQASSMQLSRLSALLTDAIDRLSI